MEQAKGWPVAQEGLSGKDKERERVRGRGNFFHPFVPSFPLLFLRRRGTTLVMSLPLAHYMQNCPPSPPPCSALQCLQGVLI